MSTVDAKPASAPPAGREAESCLACGTSLSGAEAFEAPDYKEIVEGTFRVVICPSCAGGTTTPIVPAAELGDFYEAEDYGPHVSAGFTAKMFRRAMTARLRLTRLFAPLRRRQPGAFLDLGCGRGDLAAAVAARGWTVEGLDPSPVACEAARARGVEARQGTIEQVQLPPCGYDAIVFHHSLEHVTDPVAALRIAREALKPGGLLLVAVPNFGSNRARRNRQSWPFLELPRHRFHFTEEALGAALKSAGYEVESLRSAPALVGAAASIQQRIVGRFLEAGPLFMLGYVYNFAVLPFAWLRNRIAGGGELLNAVATRPR